MTENPYESPRGMSDESPVGMSEGVELLPPPTGDRWKLILLGVSISFGLISYVPWLAVIFALLSAPVFLRSYFRSRRADPSGSPSRLEMHVVGIGGGIGLAVSILAASAGTFLGTCTAVAIAGCFPTYALMHHDPALDRIMKGIIYGSVLIGAAAFVTAATWLFRRTR